MYDGPAWDNIQLEKKAAEATEAKHMVGVETEKNGAGELTISAEKGVLNQLDLMRSHGLAVVTSFLRAGPLAGGGCPIRDVKGERERRGR